MSKKKAPMPKKYLLIYAVLLGIFIFSAYNLIEYYYNNYQSEQIVENLTDVKNEVKKITDTMLHPHNSSISTTSDPVLPSVTDFEPDKRENENIGTSTILAAYRELYNENHDLAGWITIANTNIDYPVMYRKGDNKTYLTTDFKGNDGSLPGSIFIDGRSQLYTDEASTNLILYGHNMRVGTMFHDIMNYKDESFYLSHPVIQYDTLYETGTYDILAVFPVDIADEKQNFAYYDYYHVTNQRQFERYIDGVKRLSLYDTGIAASWGDSLITLSTCADHNADTTKRFVVVAKKRK